MNLVYNPRPNRLLTIEALLAGGIMWSLLSFSA